MDRRDERPDSTLSFIPDDEPSFIEPNAPPAAGGNIDEGTAGATRITGSASTARPDATERMPAASPEFCATVVGSLATPSSDTEKTAALPAHLSEMDTTKLRAQILRLGIVSEKNWDEAVAQTGGGDLHRILTHLRSVPATWDKRYPALTDYQCMAINQGLSEKLRIDRYVILDLIGAGGMGRVFKARNVNLPMIVALKTIFHQGSGSSTASKSGFEARFKQEAVLLAMLRHPCIPTVHDYGEHEGSSYLVMEYLEGVDFDKYIKDRMPEGGVPELDVRWVIEKIINAADALHYAHTQPTPVIHRDIKPSNIMITKSNDVKVLDLGIAKLVKQRAFGDEAGPEEQTSAELTAGGGALGTLRYMAPEQLFDARKVTPASDVYSLGVTLYRILSGRVIDLATTVIPVSELRNDASPGLDAVIAKMIERDPDLRYQSMADAIRDLKPYSASAVEEPTLTRATAGAHVQPQQGSFLGIAIGLLLFIGAAAGGVVYWAVNSGDNSQQQKGGGGAGGSGAVVQDFKSSNKALEQPMGLLSSGKYDQARDEFMKVFEQQSDPGTKSEARMGVFVANLNRGQYSQAVEDYAEAQKVNAATADKLAEQYLSQYLNSIKTDPRKVLEIDRELGTQPFFAQQSEAVLRAHGDLLKLLADSEPGTALVHLRTLDAKKQINTLDAETRNAAATATVKAASSLDYQSKLEEYRKALAFNPEGAGKAQVLLARGSAYLAKSDLDRAIADLSEAYSLDKNNKEVQAAAADAYFQRAKSLANSPDALLKRYAEVEQLDDGLLSTPHKELAAAAHGMILTDMIDKGQDANVAIDKHWKPAIALNRPAALKYASGAAKALLAVGKNAENSLRFDLAIERYTEAISYKPDDKTVLARAYYARALAKSLMIELPDRLKNDFAESTKDYAEARSNDPKTYADAKKSPIYVALIEQGANRQLIDRDKIAYFQHAKAIDPANKKEYARLEKDSLIKAAQQLKANFQFDEAVKLLEQAQAALIDPSATETQEVNRLLGETIAMKADGDVNAGNIDAAISAYKKALSYDKDNSTLIEKASKVAVRAFDREKSEGITFFGEAQQIGTNDPDKAIAKMADAKSQFENGVKVLLQAADFDKSPDILQRIGSMHVLIGHADGYCGRLKTPASRDFFKRGEQAYGAAIKIDKGNGEAYYWRGFTRWNDLGDRKGAVEDMKIAASMQNYAKSPRGEFSKQADAYNQLGNWFGDMSAGFFDLKQAITYAEKAVDISQRRAYAHLRDLAVLYAFNNQTDEARRTIEEAYTAAKATPRVPQADLTAIDQIRQKLAGN